MCVEAGAPPSGNEKPASTIFVGNLSYDLTDKDVTEFFGQVGPVKTVRIVTERETGKPRGFGFVEFFDIATADSAIRNLSGLELSGRTIRCTFAEGGPGDFRPSRREDDRFPDDRRPRASSGNKIVGPDLAYHAAQGVAVLLGGAPAPASAPADAVCVLLARKSRGELYEVMSQMQELGKRDPGAARRLLAGNPALARAIFQAQVILGMVGNPLGDVAPKGVAPPGMLGGRHHEPPLHGPSPEQQQGAPHGYAPPMQQQGPPPMQQQPTGMHGGPYGPPQPMHPGGPGPMPQYMQPQQQQQYMQPPQQYLPPVEAPPQMGMPQPGPAYPTDPRLAAPQDPRLAAMAPVPAPAPRPMISLASAGQPPPALQQQQPAPMQTQAPSVPGGADTAGMVAEQQQALLQQVLSLTPQQIELLPPQQRAQVQALQAQLRGQS